MIHCIAYFEYMIKLLKFKKKKKRTIESFFHYCCLETVAKFLDQRFKPKSINLTYNITTSGRINQNNLSVQNYSIINFKLKFNIFSLIVKST